MSEITGISVVTIRRGRAELDRDLQDRPTERIRLSGGGRPLSSTFSVSHVRETPCFAGSSQNDAEFLHTPCFRGCAEINGTPVFPILPR